MCCYDKVWFNRWYWNERNPSFTQDILQTIARLNPDNDTGEHNSTHLLNSIEEEEFQVNGHDSAEIEDQECNILPSRVTYNDMCFIFQRLLVLYKEIKLNAGTY